MNIEHKSPEFRAAFHFAADRWPGRGRSYWERYAAEQTADPESEGAAARDALAAEAQERWPGRPNLHRPLNHRA